MKRLAMIGLPLAALVGLLGGCAATHGEICSDYLSGVNCAGRGRETHQGIDFRGSAGTAVISATHGTVVRRLFNECAGPGMTIRTDIVGRHGDVEGPIFAQYWHMEPLAELAVSQRVAPGQVIGHIIPLRGTRCYGSSEHVHYELRVRDAAARHVDPHQFWADGPGKVTCFASDKPVPPGKAVVPVRC